MKIIQHIIKLSFVLILLFFSLKTVGQDKAALYSQTMKAIESNNLLKLKEILLAGADVNYQGYQYNNASPLMFANNQGNLLMVKFLIYKGANQSVTNMFGKTALDLANQAGNTEIADFLKNPVITLHDFLEFDMENEVYTAINLGKNDINLTDNQNQTLLHKAVLLNNRKLLDLLLKKNANINATDAQGRTPLLLAGLIGNIEIAELLLKKKAKPEIRDTFGISIAQIANYRNYKTLSKQIEKLKLDLGTQPKAQTEFLVSVGHAGNVTALSFSPNGKLAVSGSADYTVKLWEVASGKELLSLRGHKNQITKVKFSPNGLFILSASVDKTIKLWDAITGLEIRTFSKHSNKITDLAFSPDSKYAASVCNTVNADNLVVWEILSGKTVYKNRSDGELAFLSTSNQLLFTGLNNKILLVDYATADTIKTFEYPIRYITKLAVSNNNLQFAAADSKGTILVYDLQNGTNTELKAHNQAIADIWFTNTGNLLVSASTDKTIKIWNLEQQKIIAETALSSGIYSLALSPNNRYILAGTGYDPYKETATATNNRIHLFDLESLTEIRPFAGFTQAIKELDVSPDGFHFATTQNYSNQIKLWNLAGTERQKNLTGHTKSVKAITFSPDGEYLLSGSEDGTAKLWDVKSGNNLLTNAVHKQAVNAVAFYPDSLLAISSSDDLLSCWNIATGTEVWNTKYKMLYDVQITPNEQYLAAAGFHSVHLWNSDKKEIINPSPNCWGCAASYLKYSKPICISHDSKYIFSLFVNLSENQIIMNEIATSDTVRVFTGHTSTVQSLDISPDGKLLLSASYDKTARIWNIETGEELSKVSHADFIEAAKFTPDGTYFLTASSDHTVKLWKTENAALVATFLSINESDWMIVAPDNFYMCSKNARDAVGFKRGFETYTFEQFDLQYNRPDIVLARIGYAPEKLIETFRNAYLKRLKNMKVSEEMFGSDFHFPEIVLLNEEKLPLKTGEKSLLLNIKALDSKYLLKRLNIWVNDVPVYGTSGLEIASKQTFEQAINVQLTSGKNKIQLSVMNEKLSESTKITVEIVCEAPAEKPNLYLVAFGAGEYADSKKNLKYAVKDAHDLANFFGKNTDLYHTVFIDTIVNNEVVKSSFSHIKEKLMQSKPNDNVIIFWAGHGLLSSQYDYYLASYDVNFSEPETSGVAYEMLENLLDGIPARNKVLLIDACHSGEVDKDEIQSEKLKNTITQKRNFRAEGSAGYSNKTSTFDLMKQNFADLRRGSGATVVSSAGGTEFAMEGSEWQNGVFTYCLLSGISSKEADLNNDGKFMLSELQQYLTSKVQELTDGKQKPTSRIENLTNDFRIW